MVRAAEWRTRGLIISSLGVKNFLGGFIHIVTVFLSPVEISFTGARNLAYIEFIRDATGAVFGHLTPGTYPECHNLRESLSAVLAAVGAATRSIREVGGLLVSGGGGSFTIFLLFTYLANACGSTFGRSSSNYIDIT